MTPIFLTLHEVLEIHRDQVARYGGATEVVDWGLLESAVAQPAAQFSGKYLHRDLFEMAAAYLFHLVQNLPFAGGNKRVGPVAAIVFLLMNGQDIQASPNELLQLVLQVANSHADKTAVTQFFRDHAV